MDKIIKFPDKNKRKCILAYKLAQEMQKRKLIKKYTGFNRSYDKRI